MERMIGAKHDKLEGRRVGVGRVAIAGVASCRRVIALSCRATSPHVPLRRRPRARRRLSLIRSVRAKSRFRAVEERKRLFQTSQHSGVGPTERPFYIMPDFKSARSEKFFY